MWLLAKDLFTVYIVLMYNKYIRISIILTCKWKALICNICIWVVCTRQLYLLYYSVIQKMTDLNWIVLCKGKSHFKILKCGYDCCKVHGMSADIPFEY